MVGLRCQVLTSRRLQSAEGRLAAGEAVAGAGVGKGVGGPIEGCPC